MRRAHALLGASLLLSACATPGERADRGVALALPQAWTAGAPAAAPAVQPWLQDFGDTPLASLVEEAFRHNFSLKAAAERVRAARAEARVAGAALGPQIDAAAGATRTDRELDDATRVRTSDYDASVQISWEADLWGRLRATSRAAALDAEAEQARLQAARLSLAAAVADAWVRAVEAARQVQLAERTVRNFRDNLAIIEEGYRRGINAALDVRLARANVAAAQSSREAQRVVGDAALRELATLVGRYPRADIELPGRLPALRGPVATGMPASLLARRPDVLAARRQLAAADERLLAATLNRMPSLRLGASGGAGGTSVGDVLRADALFWSLAADVLQPVFEGGRLAAEREAADARAEEAFARYADTVLTALREVETALAAESLLAGQQRALASAAEESVQAEALAAEQYQAGLTGIITLLESQRRAFDAQRSLIGVQSQRLQNRINLYLALGGPVVTEPVADTAAGLEEN